MKKIALVFVLLATVTLSAQAIPIPTWMTNPHHDGQIALIQFHVNGGAEYWNTPDNGVAVVLTASQAAAVDAYVATSPVVTDRQVLKTRQDWAQYVVSRAALALTNRPDICSDVAMLATIEKAHPGTTVKVCGGVK